MLFRHACKGIQNKGFQDNNQDGGCIEVGFLWISFRIIADLLWRPCTRCIEDVFRDVGLQVGLFLLKRIIYKRLYEEESNGEVKRKLPSVEKGIKWNFTSFVISTKFVSNVYEHFSNLTHYTFFNSKIDQYSNSTSRGKKMIHKEAFAVLLFPFSYFFCHCKNTKSGKYFIH